MQQTVAAPDAFVDEMAADLAPICRDLPAEEFRTIVRQLADARWRYRCARRPAATLELTAPASDAGLLPS